MVKYILIFFVFFVGCENITPKKSKKIYNLTEQNRFNSPIELISECIYLDSLFYCPDYYSNEIVAFDTLGVVKKRFGKKGKG